MTGLSTNAIHGGDHLHRVSDVTPPINISTTFKYSSDPDKLQKAADTDNYFVVGNPIYSRATHPSGELVEAAVGKITNSYAIAYSSGLSAFFALLTHKNPRQLFIGEGYHGCHGIADIFTRNNGLKQLTLSDDDLNKAGKGDIVHLESPINPSSTVFDIQYFADKAHSKGAILVVDSTFAPPPLLDAFEFGADIVMHSATKYFGGHSDLLAGLLLTKDESVRRSLIEDRLLLGTNIANLESALLLRSLKTLEVRVTKQSKTATELVDFLSRNIDKYPALTGTHHSSLQKEEYVARQMKGGHSPTFSITLASEDQARRFPSLLRYFYHATSLGGVESLVEWRAMTDESVSPTLLRISVGLENVEDLIEDLDQALKKS